MKVFPVLFHDSIKYQNYKGRTYNDTLTTNAQCLAPVKTQIIAMSYNKRIPVSRILLAAIVVSLASAPASSEEPSLGESLQTIVARYQTSSGGASVGLHVINLADGAVLCDIDSAKPMIPASNQKILTSAVAMKRLGADFKFRTKLTVAGKDLVVTGDGDPTTGDARLAEARNETIYATFDRWAEALKSKGVKEVSNLVIRAGIFHGPYVHPDWPAGQRQRWYAAPVAGVNFNNNCLDIGFAVRGKRVWPLLTPVSRFIQVSNRVRLGKRHLWHCRFGRSGVQVTLTGTVTRSTPNLLPVAAPDPPALFAAVLADRLVRAGIAVKGKIMFSNDWPVGYKDMQQIATAETPLASALLRANKQSLNMMAECIFLRSALTDGKPATWTKSAQVARKTLLADYGLKAGQFTVADGSGLSRRNRASAATLTTLLQKLASEKQFVRSLAIAGIDGSLRRKLAGPAKGRILGKTGSLVGVSALSGYVLDRKAAPKLAFSIIVNGRTGGKGFSARSLQRDICEMLIRAIDAPTTKPK